jgi:hypothetical protein
VAGRFAPTALLGPHRRHLVNERIAEAARQIEADIAERARREERERWREALDFAERHSIPDHNDGNVRVERGAWSRLFALLAEAE